jgi:DNA-binding response OmpR family regulator
VTGARILLVEDDVGISGGLTRALRAEGYEVVATATGQAAVSHAATADPPPDVVLLDLGLPDGDGLAVCATLTELRADMPIIVLTARGDELDVVVGLDAGAVDYITKPFRLAELLARLRAQLRRPAVHVDRTEVGPLVVDASARRVYLSGREIELRQKEFDLLAALADAAGRVMTRDELMARVWDDQWYGSTKTLDVHIASLRRKLGDDGSGPLTITTLRGVGFRFERP